MMSKKDSDISRSQTERNSARYCESLSKRINDDLAVVVSDEFPPNLYEPIRYVLASKGKRFRPILLLLSCEATGGTIEEAYNASLAIEILHNFTLVHDDIMDNDELRRGLKTVHKKWNSNIAILAGDGLIALAYRYLLESQSGQLKKVVQIFSEAIINICEGQSIDKDFELEHTVSIDDYLDMIKRKTAVLISISAQLGGILGDGKEEDIKLLREYGLNLGMAFQIQDDLFDIISDEVTIGKDMGSDIAEGKKTFPLIMLSKRASQKDCDFLNSTFAKGSTVPQSFEKIQKMLHEYGVVDKTLLEIDQYIDAACAHLKSNPKSLASDHLIGLAEMIRNRMY
jgi:geranylgeranyl diphosphate synthase type II